MELCELIKNLYGTDKLDGYSDEDIAFLKEMFGDLPEVLEDYYRKAGRTEILKHLQDEWILPEHYKNWHWLKQKKDFYILMNENQGVFQLGIRREDMSESNPPVYYIEDGITEKYCDSLSEFLLCQSAYQAVFTFEYSPEEFYSITEDEFEIVKESLQKYPFELKNDEQDYPFNMSFYYNASDNLYVVMRYNEDDMQVLYGAVSEKSFDELEKIVGNLGEPM